MSKIFNQTEIKEIEHFISTNDNIAPELKTKIRVELQNKYNKWKNHSIWLVSRNEVITIDVFDIKGDVIETDSFYYKDYFSVI